MDSCGQEKAHSGSVNRYYQSPCQSPSHSGQKVNNSRENEDSKWIVPQNEGQYPHLLLRHSSLIWGFYNHCSRWHTCSASTYAKSLSWVSQRVVNLPNSVMIRREDHTILSGDKKVAWMKALLMSLFLNGFLICRRVPDRADSGREWSAVAMLPGERQTKLSAVQLQLFSEFIKTGIGKSDFDST